MANKLKLRAPMKAPREMERNIQQIYDDLNDIINSVNSFALSGEEFEGKSGDIRLIEEQQTDGTSKYYIRAKTNDGWVQVEATSVG
jgi:hypothetical protein